MQPKTKTPVSPSSSSPSPAPSSSIATVSNRASSTRSTSSKTKSHQQQQAQGQQQGKHNLSTTPSSPVSPSIPKCSCPHHHYQVRQNYHPPPPQHHQHQNQSRSPPSSTSSSTLRNMVPESDNSPTKVQKESVPSSPQLPEVCAWCSAKAGEPTKTSLPEGSVVFVEGDSSTQLSLSNNSTEREGTTRVVSLWACSGCLKIAYCSKDCQRTHWKTHKTQCFIDQARNWINDKRSNNNHHNNHNHSHSNGHYSTTVTLSKSSSSSSHQFSYHSHSSHHSHSHHNHHLLHSSKSYHHERPQAYSNSYVHLNGSERGRDENLPSGSSVMDLQEIIESSDSDSENEETINNSSSWDRTIADLWRRTDIIQRQHEALQRDLNTTIQALTESLRTFNIPLPPGTAARKKTKPLLASMKTPEHLSSLWQRCTSPSEKTQLSATKECRKLLSDQHPPIKELVDMGLIPIFVNLLRKSRNPKLQFEAAWVLTNICSGTSEQTQAVIESGAVAALTDLLCSKDEELAEQCVWALGNIAADSPSCRDILLEHGIIEALIPLLNSNRLTMLKNLSWTMSNLCNGVRECHWGKILMALGKFSRLIFCSDEEILKDVCWSLSYLSGATKDSIQAIVELDPLVCKRLVELLTHRSPSVQHAALIAVGNIVTGDDEQTQILIDHQILPRLRRLLAHSKTSILKDTCFTLSNIAAGNQTQIQSLIDSRIIPALINLYTSAKYEVKVEATWALSNALSNGTDPQIRYLVNSNCMKPMCDLLLLCDLSTIEAVLEGFEHILRVGDTDSLIAPSPSASSSPRKGSTASFSLRKGASTSPTPSRSVSHRNLFAEKMKEECLDMLQILQRHINESLISTKIANLIARLVVTRPATLSSSSSSSSSSFSSYSASSISSSSSSSSSSISSSSSSSEHSDRTSTS